MGQVTPNISIYIPAAGETNYDASFAAGMVNIDQHDHTGGPNKGLPITAAALAAGSVTYDKLNANVADTTTGIGTHTGGLANQLMLLGLLSNIYNVGTTNGYLVKNGSAAAARTLTGNTQIKVTNGDGTVGDPVFSLETTFYQEGAWQPFLAGSVTPGTLVYTNQNGTWQRIGNWVECYGYIRSTTVSVAMAGELRITNFPFTFANSVANFTMGQVDMAITVATQPTTVGGTAPFIRGKFNDTYATVLFYNPTTGADDTLDASTWANPDDLAFRIRYQIQ